MHDATNDALRRAVYVEMVAVEMVPDWPLLDALPQVFKPVPATDDAMCKFHAPDYISFLKHISPDNQVPSTSDLARLLMLLWAVS